MRPIGIILIFFGTSLVAHAFPKHCLSSFKKLSPGELRYVAQEFLQKHNTRYSVEIPSTPVSDQCNYGSCWLHARLAHVEEGIKNKTGKTLRINRTFLIAQSLLDRIDDALESPHSPIFQGGNANYADELVRRYGFIPEDPEIWKPRVNFEKAPHGSRLTYFLNARAAQFHEAAKNLTPESRAYLDLQDEARRDMRNILKAYTGPLPRKFEFDGKSYTPKQFSKEIAGNYSPKPLWVYPEVDLLEGNLKRETTIGPVPLPKKVSSSRESLDKIEKRIIQSLQNGQSVTLSYENNTLFVDRETGIMSLSAFHTPEGFSPPSRLYRDAFQLASGFHAVDVVGVDLDADGKIIKLKLKNSWGKDAGDEGYYHMYRDYFEHFMGSIYLSDSESSRPTPRP